MDNATTHGLYLFRRHRLPGKAVLSHVCCPGPALICPWGPMVHNLQRCRLRSSWRGITKLEKALAPLAYSIEAAVACDCIAVLITVARQTCSRHPNPGSFAFDGGNHCRDLVGGDIESEAIPRCACRCFLYGSRALQNRLYTVGPDENGRAPRLAHIAVEVEAIDQHRGNGLLSIGNVEPE